MAKKLVQGTGGQLAELIARKPVQLIVIAAAILLCYGHTLDVPFYYDDSLSIRTNPAIRDLSLSALWSFAAARIVGYFTLAVNYALHGYDLAGYHAVNILIHILASLLVYQVAGLLLKTPRMANSSVGNHESMRTWLPFLAALLFALHPLQIQAVTYIVQRLASLAALFYLAGISSYLRARLTQSPVQAAVLGLLTLVFFLLAVFTKQNAATLPLALLVIELCFFRHSRIQLIAGACLAVIVLGAALYLAQWWTEEDLLALIATSTQETTLVTRSQYLAIQMLVLWNYLFKFVFPVNLTLNYEFTAPDSFFTPLTLLFAFLHLCMLVLGVLLARRSPLLGFGILFYYIAHLVESSVIPIRDFGFDHRTYLPNTGFCLAASWLLLAFMADRRRVRAFASGTAIYLVVLAGLTWQRNSDWRDPVAFFEHEIAVNADSFRSHCMLGEAHYVAGQLEQAVAVYRMARPLFGASMNRGNNTEESCFSNYAATLQEAGYLDEARQLIAAMRVSTYSRPIQSKVVVTLGNIEALRQNFPRAEEYFIQARQLDPQNVDAIANLAKLKILTNELQESLELFRLVNEMDPTDPDGITGLEYLSGLLQE